jgi:hypothetical protein
MRAAVPLAVGLVAVTAGCGDGGSDTRAAKHAIKPNNQRQAKAINLRLSDFPDGWRASSRTDDTAAQKKFRKCLGIDMSKITVTGDASSKDFAKGDNATADSDAWITETVSQARDSLTQLARGLSSTGTKDCVRDAIGSTPGYQVGEIDVGELKTTSPPEVDETRAWEVVIPVEVTSGTDNGLSVSVYVDLVYLRKGNILASVSTSDVLSPLDDALRAHLVRTVAQRMSKEPT